MRHVLIILCLLAQPVWAAPTLIEYVTDIGKWTEFVHTSKTLERDQRGQLHVRPGCLFVYGGDTLDRMPGELAFLQELVPLAESQPDQVKIILGNRDVNKMFMRTYQPNVSELQSLFQSIAAPRLFENHRPQLANAGLPSSIKLCLSTAL